MSKMLFAVLVFVIGGMVGIALYVVSHPKDIAAQAAYEKEIAVERQKRHDAEMLKEVANAMFVFDPTTSACYMGSHFGNYGRTFSQVTCEAARRRLSSFNLEMLENAERQLGYKIP